MNRCQKRENRRHDGRGSHMAQVYCSIHEMWILDLQLFRALFNTKLTYRILIGSSN